MKIHEFYQQYANLPLDKRGQVLDFGRLGVYKMKDVYFEIETVQAQQRNCKESLEALLDIAEEFLPKLRKKS